MLLRTCNGGDSLDEKVRCPECNKYEDVGKIGTDKHFCSACCVEFQYKDNMILISYIGPNGLVTQVKTIIKK
jgi:hypothetical protein